MVDTLNMQADSLAWLPAYLEIQANSLENNADYSIMQIDCLYGENRLPRHQRTQSRWPHTV